MQLKAPFPYFGGKSTIATDIWRALGQPKHYLEPFFGSGAVLLARPHWQPSMVETVCDADGFLCNVWRSLQFNPDEVARWCDWPVNHVDLMARRKALLKNEGRLLENLTADEKWYDPVMAGYWIWAASCWIGSGLTSLNAIPHISGINAQRPHISDAGTGINAQIPHISHAGTGINAQRPHISHAGTEVQDPYKTGLWDWFRALSERLRYVRVVCGDWTRICGGNWQDKMGAAGIFFDPPYGVTDRDGGIYHNDSLTVAQDVNMWCLERGKIKTYRIVLAGYYEEHLNLLDAGWSVKRWKAQGGYSSTGNNAQGKANACRETLFLSPHCHRANGLFDTDPPLSGL